MKHGCAVCGKSYDPRQPHPCPPLAAAASPPPPPPAYDEEAPSTKGDEWDGAFTWPIDLGLCAGFNVRGEWRGEDLWLRLPMVGPIRVPFSGSTAWTLVSREPLTVKPSIKVLFGDGVDRVHGFVTEGRWVSCV